MSAADETVILPRDPAEIERVAAERVHDAVREHKGEDFARLLKENKRLRDANETLAVVNDRLEHTLRQVRDERDGLRAEIERMTTPRMFRSVDSLAQWITEEFERLGATRMSTSSDRNGHSIGVLMEGDRAVELMVYAPSSSRGLAWIRTCWSDAMDAELAEIAANGGFSRTDRDGTWCVTLTEEPKP